MRLPVAARALAGAGAVWAGAVLAGPGELTVLSVPSLQPALGEALARYEQDTGNRVAAAYAMPSRLAARLGADHPDLVVLAEEDLDALQAGGRAAATERMALARDGLGLAAKQGSAPRDVSTPAAVRQTLLGAASLAYLDPADHAAGRQAAAAIAALGLADALKPKTRLATGGNALAPVGVGEVELGLYPMSQVRTTPGVQLVGPLPAELQRWTRYQVAVLDDAPNAGEARRLLRHLTGEAGREALRAKGLEPAPR